MERAAKRVRPYHAQLKRICRARSYLTAAAILMVLAFIGLLTFDSGGALVLAATIAALILVAYAYSTPCPMCGHPFYLRLVPRRSLLGHFARETTMFDVNPHCVTCGFEPEIKPDRRRHGMANNTASGDDGRQRP